MRSCLATMIVVFSAVMTEIHLVRAIFITAVKAIEILRVVSAWHCRHECMVAAFGTSANRPLSSIFFNLESAGVADATNLKTSALLITRAQPQSLNKSTANNIRFYAEEATTSDQKAIVFLALTR